MSVRDGLITQLKESDNAVSRFFGNLFDKIASLQDVVINQFKSVLDFGNKLYQAFLDKIKEVIDSIANNWKNFFAWTHDLVSNLTDFRDQVLLKIPLAIYEKMKTLFDDVFLPDPDKMQARLNHLNERFSFVESLSSFGTHVLKLLQNATGAKAPVVTLNLGSYRGKYGWGGAGKVTIDFSWYAEYKPLVDNLLAGIIWINWLWHTYKRIPEIIHGLGMTTEKAIDIAGRDI